MSDPTTCPLNPESPHANSSVSITNETIPATLTAEDDTDVMVDPQPRDLTPPRITAGGKRQHESGTVDESGGSGIAPPTKKANGNIAEDFDVSRHPDSKLTHGTRNGMTTFSHCTTT